MHVPGKCVTSKSSNRDRHLCGLLLATHKALRKVRTPPPTKGETGNSGTVHTIPGKSRNDSQTRNTQF